MHDITPVFFSDGVLWFPDEVWYDEQVVVNSGVIVMWVRWWECLLSCVADHENYRNNQKRC